MFETFAAMAEADPDGMLSLARELDDPSVRMRSLVSIARAMVREARGGSPASRPQTSDPSLPQPQR